MAQTGGDMDRLALVSLASIISGPTWAENYELGMAAHAWGWPLTPGDGRPHVETATHTWGWRVHTWGWPLTPGDGGCTPWDGHSNLGMPVYVWGWRVTSGDGGPRHGDGHAAPSEMAGGVGLRKAPQKRR